MVRNGTHHEGDFVCKRCGDCCTGNGFVNLDRHEAKEIAKTLGLSLDDFQKRYTQWKDGFELWLVHGEGEEQPCVFLERDAMGLVSCRIEGESKPRQCREFPLTLRHRRFQEWCAAFQE